MLIFIDNIFPWFGDMLELGGNILLFIILLSAMMWSLILERLVYIWFVYPRKVRIAISLWRKRNDHSSWFAKEFRTLIIARLSSDLEHNITLIRTLVKVCPLLGLLGTVLGMLEVFDAIGITGSNDPRSTAAGISKATVTTMAGMVVAISGLMISNYLAKHAKDEENFLGEKMSFDINPEQQNG